MDLSDIDDFGIVGGGSGGVEETEGSGLGVASPSPRGASPAVPFDAVLRPAWSAATGTMTRRNTRKVRAMRTSGRAVMVIS
ncbi:MAG: hypothetical protein AB7S61_07380 [Methanoregulaceae archaeon]